MPLISPRTVVDSAARTATGNSGAISLHEALKVDAGEVDIDSINLVVDVTAVSGTSPTLDLSVEWSHNGTDFAAVDTPDTFTQITGTTKKVKRFTIKGSHYRVVWTLAGTSPNFTFSISEVAI